MNGSDKRIVKLYLDVTERCNLNCRHCYNGGNAHAQDMSRELAERIIDEYYHQGGRELYFSGGEPLLYPDFMSLLRWVDADYPKMKKYVLTNGTLIDDMFLSYLQGHRNTMVQISLDGMTPEVHDLQRGHGAFVRTMGNIQRLRDIAYPNVMLRMAVNRHNVRELDEILRFAQKIQWIVTFIFVQKLGNAVENWDDLELSVQEKLDAAEKIEHFYEGCSYSASVPSPLYTCSLCNLESKDERQYSVRTDGKVVLCSPLTDMPLGDLNVETLSDLNQKDVSEYIRLVDKRREYLLQGVCKNCVVKDVCTQGCFGRAHIAGDDLGLDGDCKYRIMDTLKKSIPKILSKRK
ncbi:MAG: radical SAM protein [Clostridia bacterium]|nr:radical SAM protein [Clostridia bacterium]